MVNEAVGVWYEEQGSDLELHLPHLTVVLQDSLQGHRMVSEPKSEQAGGWMSQALTPQCVSILSPEPLSPPEEQLAPVRSEGQAHGLGKTLQ